MGHPVDEIRGTKSEKLKDKVIVLGVTGSIAAVETVKVGRELIRHGATVIPVMTPHAQHIIHPSALEYATGEKVICHLTGQIEHVKFCGAVESRADAVVIAPCTANTLSKISLGIDDTPVTTFVTTALGSDVPVVIVPAMHATMYQHPKIQEHIASCAKMGIGFVKPVFAEGKAKMISTEEIVANVIRAVGRQVLKEKKVLIVGGATSEAIDDVRVISNVSSGKMALSLARKAFEMGAHVTLWYGYGAGYSQHPPSYLDVSFFCTSADLVSLIDGCDHFDIIVNCAAISDYKPHKQRGKIPSGQKLSLSLRSTPSINRKLRKIAVILVGFKLEATPDNIVEKAYTRLTQQGLDYIIANTIDTLGRDKGRMWLITRDKQVFKKQGTKDDLAGVILTKIHD